jgi:hypothetical protein
MKPHPRSHESMVTLNCGVGRILGFKILRAGRNQNHYFGKGMCGEFMVNYGDKRGFLSNHPWSRLQSHNCIGSQT